MSERKINMAMILERSTANGSGTRAVVWVQGCPLRCPGCFNPEYQEFRQNQTIPVTELANKILITEGIDGVSFSGGEPFAQAAALADLAEILQQHGLTVLIFTGYAYAELIGEVEPKWKPVNWKADFKRLLDSTDMLVSGRFEQDKVCTGKSLIGSSNQKIISLSGGMPIPSDGEIPDIELQFTDNGTMYITGFPDQKVIDSIKAGLHGE